MNLTEIVSVFFWYKVNKDGERTLTGFKSKRLMFGLKPSPCLLMLSLYKILIIDQDEDTRLNEIKTKLFNCFYMDNGGYTCNNEQIHNVYKIINQIFQSRCMLLQQFNTNSCATQNLIDSETAQTTSTSV